MPLLSAHAESAPPGVVVGVLVGILLAGASNPYLFAAFGLLSILMMVAWLEEAYEAPGGEPARDSWSSVCPLRERRS